MFSFAIATDGPRWGRACRARHGVEPIDSGAASAAVKKLQRPYQVLFDSFLSKRVTQKSSVFVQNVKIILVTNARGVM